MPSIAEVTRRQLTLRTHRIYSLPIVVLMPHSRCNCRCVMCDIWKANRNGTELTAQDLAPHMETFRNLNVQWVTLSGGEALMHSNLWTLCRQLKELDVRITLLSTGLLLGKYAAEVRRWCDEVIVSLDGSRQVHNEIRNVPRAFERLAEGVAALRRQESALPIRGRCVVQRRNYRDLPQIINAAHEIGLEQISFLAADVSTTAFNRPEAWDGERVADVALSPAEVEEFEQILEDTLRQRASDISSGFVAESPDKLRDLAQYYRALNGDASFPPIGCNAPWVSTVIEADGTVRPCFFHEPLGNVHDAPLEAILNSQRAIEFRRTLDMEKDPVCRKCVCTLSLGSRQDVTGG